MRIFTIVVSLLGVFFTMMAWSAEPEFAGNWANEAAVAEVAAGTRTEANAAWWGFDPEDATAAMQAAIDSNAPRVRIPYMGRPWIVTPIRLRDNLELHFEPGVVVLAKEGQFKGKSDSLFTAANAANITFRGYGATLRMRKADYQSDAYEKAEWRMGLAFRGCRNIRVEGLRLEGSGGDGIYLGATQELAWCEDVVIRDVICHDHHRQGISVIGAVNLLIENTVMTDTSGTAPAAGIDFEPNHPREKLVNCLVRNCVFSGNQGAGILLYLKNLDAGSSPVSLTFEDCFVGAGNSSGIVIGAVNDQGPGGQVEFRNCTVENPHEHGLRIYDKAASSVEIRFTNCHWSGSWSQPGKQADVPRSPLEIELRRQQITREQGGVAFDACYVYDTVDRPVLAIREHETEFGARNVSGTLFVVSPHAPRMDPGPNPKDVAVELVHLP
ncbi:MAG TPA: right-handed parallel beta-helix repeat-containing protein [Candidatus Hydrogenedentes bacterium]|nr:right-handed parallel beta-helix repeat-containing protein [Candidatus Hydrogenedentota bacterium]